MSAPKKPDAEMLDIYEELARMFPGRLKVRKGYLVTTVHARYKGNRFIPEPEMVLEILEWLSAQELLFSFEQNGHHGCQLYVVDPEQDLELCLELGENLKEVCVKAMRTILEKADEDEVGIPTESEGPDEVPEASAPVNPD